MKTPADTSAPRLCRAVCVAVLGLAVAFHPRIARSEPVDRKPSESDDDFMARVIGRSAELAQKVVRSTEFDGRRLTLIGFVNFKDETKDHSHGGDSLVGHLLMQASSNHYEHITFPSCGEEGGAPELMAVFFARTAKGAGRDLAAMCKWESQGVCYAAEFYRVSTKGSRTVVEALSDLNKNFETCDEVGVNKKGEWVRTRRAEFKTVAEVKKRLAKMGIDQ